MNKDIQKYTNMNAREPSLTFLALGIMMMVGSPLLLVNVSSDTYLNGISYILLGCFGLVGCWIFIYNLRGYINKTRNKSKAGMSDRTDITMDSIT